jgi:FkbM family methyltransferase
MLDAIRQTLNYTTSVRLGRARFRIPVLAGVEVRGVRETFKTRIIRDFARPNGVFVDVGTNLGQTLLDVRASHPAMRYFGFEPNPRAVAYVHKLIQANDFRHSKVVCAALSDHVAAVDLYSVPNEAADPASTLIRSQWPHRNLALSQPVAAMPFDLIASSLDARPVGFVKIDVEGAELEVLRGMRQTLENDRPPVLCEVLPPCGGSSLEQSEQRRKSITELLASVGYGMRHVGVDGSTNSVAGFSAGPYSPQLSWDYLFLPAEQIE